MVSINRFIMSTGMISRAGDSHIEQLIKLKLLKFTRKRKLASKCGVYIQVSQNGDIIGTTDSSDSYINLQVISIGSDMIALWGSEAEMYVAVDESGKLYTSPTEGRDCVFIERFTSDFFNTYTSYHSASQNNPQYLSLDVSGTVSMKRVEQGVPPSVQFRWEIPPSESRNAIDGYRTL